MHILDLAEELKLSKEFTVGAGRWLVEDVNGATLMLHADGGRMEPLSPEAIGTHRFDPRQDWNGKRILVMRTGGFGDLILMTPVLRELKRRWPQCEIHFSCLPHFRAALENLPYVDHFVSYPIDWNGAQDFDAWVLLENAIEKNPVATKVHMTDVFAGFFGLNVGDIADKKPEYRVSDREKIWAEEAYPRTPGVQRLAVQFNAQSAARTYPGPRMQEVITQLVQKGWEVMLMGKPGELQAQENERLFNLSAHKHTFRQSCAVLATSDCVLGPDSSLVHVGGALDVPTVALYGPFPPEIRVKYSPSIHVLEGSGHCAPCFHHDRKGKQWPSHGPCATKNYCVVMDGIPVRKVVDRVQAIGQKLVPASSGKN